MSQLLFLIPPSEGKSSGGQATSQHVSFTLRQPIEIAGQASEKDLKCSGKRYAEAIALNRSLDNAPVLPAIERYRGVMYNALEYSSLEQDEQAYFDQHFLMVSGLYGLLRPQDQIANYKLPVATKWIYDFWGSQLIETLIKLKADYVISLLPDDYLKLFIHKRHNSAWADFKGQFLQLKFLTAEGKRLTHNSKPIKGQWMRELCKQRISTWKDFQAFLRHPGYHIQLETLLDSFYSHR